MADEVSQYRAGGRVKQQTSGWAVGIFLALLSAIANFLFIPDDPFWALAADGRDLRDAGA
jgi:hypothetical protein